MPEDKRATTRKRVPDASSAFTRVFDALVQRERAPSRRVGDGAQLGVPAWAKSPRAVAHADSADQAILPTLRSFGSVALPPTRRRALRIIAAVGGLPLMIAAVRATASKGNSTSWPARGVNRFSKPLLCQPVPVCYTRA